MLKAVVFPMVYKFDEYDHPTIGVLVSEEYLLEDEEAALQQVRDITGVWDVDIWVEGTFRPMGEYPFSRLTVRVSIDGKVLNTFFGN